MRLDELELGREQALVGIFKSRFLKRFESSIDAFRISIRRALEFIKTFDEYLSDGRLLNSASFQAALRYLESEDDQDSDIPSSRAGQMDTDEEAATVLAELPTLDISAYDVRRIRANLREDIDALTDIWYHIKDIHPEQDAKLQKLKELLAGELRGQKLLIFTYYKDTAHLDC